MKTIFTLALMLLLSSSTVDAQVSRSAVSAKDLDAGTLSFTTEFLETEPGFLSYVGINFSGGTNAPEAVETIVVYATSRHGAAYDTELARITTVAGATRTITFLFNGSIPITGLDQVKVTCTNASQSAGETNDDPTVTVTVVIDNAERGSGNVQIFRDGSFVQYSSIHDYISHTGNVIPAANQNFGPFYSDFSEISVPADPAAGTRRLFVNGATGELSVRTAAGATVSLESGGGSGSGDIETVGNCTSGTCGIEGGTDVFPLLYEGTANGFETTFQVTDPTADNTVTFQNLGGQVSMQDAVLTAGSIPFVNSSLQLDENNTNLFWDSANARLGVGTTSPDGLLDVEGAIYVSEVSAPGTPASTKGVIYLKTDGKLYFKNDDGLEVDLSRINGQQLTGSTDNTLLGTAADTQYFSVCFPSAPATVEHVTARSCPLVMNATLQNMHCRLNVAPGVGNTRSFTIRNSGVSDTSITCTISNTAVACSDTTNTVAVTASASSPVHYDIKTVATGTPVSGSAVCSIQFN